MAAKKCIAWREPLRRELEELRRRLEGCRLCVSIAVSALRYQNADLDADVAAALQRTVADPLLDEVSNVAWWAARLKKEGRPKARKEGKKKPNRR